MSIHTKIPIFATATGIPAVLLTTSTTIDWDNSKHARWVEVYFEDSQGAGQAERIRVWIEDLGDLSKYSYFKKTDNKWASYRYLRVSDADSKKYSILASIAKEFLLNQHKLNVLKGISISGKQEVATSSSSCGNGCGGKNNCTQETLESGHRQFFKELRNLDSAWTGNYWSPVTAYIKLQDLQFSQITSKQDNKSMYGSMVYGSVDYDYKAKPDKQYFANYPSKFSFSVEEGGLIKKGSHGNDILEVSSKLKKWKTMYSRQSSSFRQCCCSNSDNSFECLLGSNFVRKESDLGKIKTGVTSSNNGCSTQSA
ncbi:hypothetical protein MHC_02805 [Mycoplasma haemocanis str. Illinois]|uniref:Uncharacterized protein n=1 Tax=Mycoplasma haemocanis (strain Illinois) TaxID=1111676 RepID=H6N701_MYCHN|nr:hypothetical protein [Mycoplasma haemocanis]AEW45423.1 hypothetical protein MHC_02805 [Mycoplasma haemocanis str. Illinois]